MKLLICDDDISTIDVIQSQLALNELGIPSLLRAYNGEAAIHIIQQERPELILCDIGMPKVDGLEVLQYVHEHRISCEFVFLACYEDFEYARKALRYGAANYLTKPVDFGELNEALHHMVEAVKERRRAAGAGADQELADQKQLEALRQIHSGACGVSPKQTQHVLQKGHVTRLEADTPVRAVFLAADSTQALNGGWSREFLCYSLERLAEEILTGYVGCVSTIAGQGERYVHTTTYIPAGKQTEDESLKRAELYASYVSVNYKMTPVCVVSEEFPLYLASEKTAHLFDQTRRVILRGGVYPLREVERLPQEAVSLLDKTLVLRLIKQKSKTAFMEEARSTVERIARGKRDNRAMMLQLKQDILQAFCSCFEDNGIPTRILLQEEELHALDQRAPRSAEDLEEFASFLFDFAQEELQRKNEETDMIGTVKRYIMNHYKEDIDRNDVAAVAYITPNYLSKRFRAEMGMSLREYINHLRIEEAKRLLLSTNATISEVASAVGYDNISYFSTVFRKICGMSPLEWCGGKREEGRP